jgi:hypothetical protein
MASNDIKFDQGSLRDVARAIAEGMREGQRAGVRYQNIEREWKDSRGRKYYWDEERITLPNGRSIQGRHVFDTMQQILRDAPEKASSSGSLSRLASGLLSKTPAGLALTASGFAVAAADQALGVTTLGRGYSNFFNPQISSTPLTGSDTSIGGYRQGRYAVNLVYNAPIDRDLLALDNHFIWNGITVSEIDMPLIYTSGEVRSQKGGGKVQVTVRAQKEFQLVQTQGAYVKSKNRLAAVQLQEMLNAGVRWWQVNQT